MSPGEKNTIFVFFTNRCAMNTFNYEFEYFWFFFLCLSLSLETAALDIKATFLYSWIGLGQRRNCGHYVHFCQFSAILYWHLTPRIFFTPLSDRRHWVNDPPERITPLNQWHPLLNDTSNLAPLTQWHSSCNNIPDPLTLSCNDTFDSMTPLTQLYSWLNYASLTPWPPASLTPLTQLTSLSHRHPNSSFLR
jgi:hypothetical protein